MHQDNDPTRSHRRTTARIVAGSLAVVLLPAEVAVAGPDFGGWAAAEKIDEVAGNHPDVNSTFLDGCPAQSPDGLRLYMASNRPDGHGRLDIWMASRQHRAAPGERRGTCPRRSTHPRTTSVRHRSRVTDCCSSAGERSRE